MSVGAVHYGAEDMYIQIRRAINVAAICALLLSCGDDTTTAPDPPNDTSDSTPPTVTTVSPTADEIGVTIHTTVTASFSEPIELASSPSTALRLEDSSGNIPGGVYQPEPDRLAFVAARPLEFGAVYTASVTTTVTDTAGNALVEDEAWSFTIAGSVPPALSESNILQHLNVLAHDSMAGRYAGSPEELASAQYIAGRFQAYGLDSGAPGYLQSFVIPFPVNGQIGVVSQNVIGILPGEGDLADEWLIVGAHYDHVGIREVSPGVFEVHNGADDNASGTSLVLELARALSEYVLGGGTAGEDRRSIMFHTYGSEEIGLVGSRHYCGNPTEPMADLVAMMNFDMVGRLRQNTVEVGGVPTSDQWADMLLRYNVDGLGLMDTGCQACSDHACFRNDHLKPVLWFHTGLHPEYHTQLDDVALINGAGIVQIGELALKTLIHVAVRPDPLVFTGTVPATSSPSRKQPGVMVN